MYKKIITAFISITFTFGTLVSPNMKITQNNIGTTILAKAETYGDYEYTLLDNGTIEISKYNGTDLEITIPSTIDGISVTSIGAYAFENCTNLTNVTLPNNLEKLGLYCFQNAGITEITIPKSVVDASYSFKDSALMTASLEEGSTKVADKLFQGCINLTVVNIPDTVTEIGSSAFKGCTSLKSFAIPDSITNIGAYAFENCTNLTNVTLPNNLEKLGLYCFQNVGITEITIPKSVVDASYSFKDSTLMIASLEEGSTKVADKLFQGCINLTVVNIPDTVTEIGSSAFKYCTNLTNITLPNSLKKLGMDSFLSTGITEITIPKSVVDASYPFEDSALTTASLESGTTIIAENLFRGCTNLTTVNIPDTVTEIGSSAFKGCTSLKSFAIPDSITNIGAYAFENCTNLTNVTLPNSLEKLGMDSFLSTGITEITIPKSVSTIRNRAVGYDNIYEKTTDFKIYCYVATEGQQYAIDNEFNYELLDHNKHTYTETITKEPTCIETGVKTFTCICGDSYTETLDKIPHNYSPEWTIDKKPTCTSEGSKSHHCTMCDDMNDITVIEKLEHTYDSGKITTAPTCTTTGIKTYTCTVCNNIKSEVLPATGHSYTATVVAPTCTEQGYTLHTCSNCGDSYKDTYTDAVGHNFGSWSITKTATCIAEGIKTRICYVCNESETQVIPKAPHSYSSDWTIDKKPTCTSEGIKSHHCTVCDDMNDITVIEKLEHSYVTTTTAPTYCEDGYSLHTCAVCGNSYKDNFKPKLNISSVSSLKRFLATDNSIRISWDKLDNVDGYIIYQYDNGKKSWNRINKITADEADGSVACTVKEYDESQKRWIRAEIDMPNIYTINGLKSGITYRFAVKAYKTISGKEVTSPEYPTLTATTKISAVDFKVKAKAQKAILTWNKMKEAIGFIVYYKRSLYDSWSILTETTDQSYTKSDLNMGEDYYFTVKAYKKSDKSITTSIFITKKIKIK